MKKILITLSVLMVIAVVALLIFYNYLSTKLDEKINLDNEITMTIPKNCSLNEAVYKINKVGAFEPKWLFDNLAKVYTMLYNHSLYAGTYRIKPGMSNREILKSIFSGSNQHIVKVTYPEGISLEKFASLTAAKVGIDSSQFIKLLMSDSLLEARKIPLNSAEGYLMPDTYEFYWMESPRIIIDRLLDEQEKFWTEKIQKKAVQSGMTRHNILTLASIIEAETSVPEESNTISGVYHNRLRKGWKLEADPTVQYALGNKKRVLYRDLEINHPYNTYKIPGLPPGPINNPGRKAISAAVSPEKHRFMYFVAKGDGSGEHLFAETYREHQNNVIKYRKNRK